MIKHGLKILVAALTAGLCGPVVAGDVQVLAADLQRTGDDVWQIRVTLRHDDTGWDHYADGWRLVDADGKVLGNRVLRHPHVDEQPFTRGLNGVTVPPDLAVAYIEAHDKVHGWSPDRLEIDFRQAGEGHLHVEKQQ